MRCAFVIVALIVLVIALAMADRTRPVDYDLAI